MMRTLKTTLLEVMQTLLINNEQRSNAMMINFYAIQVEEGWITLEQVPKKYRSKVKVLVEQANAGLEETDKEG